MTRAEVRELWLRAINGQAIEAREIEELTSHVLAVFDGLSELRQKHRSTFDIEGEDLFAVVPALESLLDISDTCHKEHGDATELQNELEDVRRTSDAMQHELEQKDELLTQIAERLGPFVKSKVRAA